MAKKSAGSTIWLGTTATDGSSDTYIKIEGVKQIPSAAGGQYQVTDTTTLEDTVRQGTKTLLDPADMELEYNEEPGAPGQAAVKSAFEDTLNDLGYNVEVRFPHGDKYRFKARVTSWTPMVGNATAVRTVRAKLERTTQSIYIAA